MKRELPEGHKVRYQHHRPLMVQAPGMKPTPKPKGGCTQAFVYDKDLNLVAEGTARCRPDETFSKHLGRTVALGRALASLERQAS